LSADAHHVGTQFWLHAQVVDEIPNLNPLATVAPAAPTHTRAKKFVVVASMKCAM
jgi:hypothetical protein